MSKRTLFLIFLLVAVVSTLSFVAILQSIEQTKKRQEVPIQTQASVPTIDPSLVPDTTLTASPSGSFLKVGAHQPVDIVIDTGNNSITTVQLEIGFDPEFLDVQSVSPGTFFANGTVLLNEVNRTTGRITFAVGSVRPQKGKGILATINFVGKKATPLSGAKATSLTFLPKTQVLGNSNKNPNSLVKTTTNAQFIIQQ